MVNDLIVRSKEGDMDSIMIMINKFNPLLKKYSYKLFYEDAYNDLLVDFIEIIKNIHLEHMKSTEYGSLVSYINKAICSSYIKRLVSLKKLHTVVLYSDLSDSKLNYIESTFANTDCYFIKDFFDLYGVITKLELMIMKMLYIQCYSVQEIANVLGITRQAVNQMKNRALRKLKILYVDKLQ